MMKNLLTKEQLLSLEDGTQVAIQLTNKIIITTKYKWELNTGIGENDTTFFINDLYDRNDIITIVLLDEDLKRSLIQRNEIRQKSIKTFKDILSKYSNQSENIDDYFELGNITIKMIEELREKCFYSQVNYEKYLVIQMVKDLIKYQNEYKNYPIDTDRLEWITREFHDSQFDYDNFENGVKKAMKYTLENYEPS